MREEDRHNPSHHQDSLSSLAKRRPVLAILAAAGLALQGCDVQHATEQPRPEESSLIGRHPPLAGTPVLLDHRFSEWETSAWLAETALCIMTARPVDLRRSGQENEFVFCEPTPAPLLGDGPPALPSKPFPQVVPMDPNSKDVLLVGTVRGPVATVDVTMFGATATSDVRSLPTGDQRQVGAYAAWLPRSQPAKDGMNLSDITAVIARDKAGMVVAKLP